MLSFEYHYHKGTLMQNNFKKLSYQELLEQFKTIIKENNLKFTAQREAILQTLYDHQEHFTSEHLYMLVKQKNPELNIGIATVYRTLALLEENGLVSSISLGMQGKKFEIANKPHHDHLICIKCGKIVEFENEQIEKLQTQIASSNGFVLTNHLMQLYGVCQECQESR
jgi:Fur family ferric uptake transcriptional regulator